MEPQDTQGLPQPADQISDEEMKAASRSLADALHVSFRLLSALMILVVGLFLFSGWRQIDQDERGVRLLFGQILGDGDQRVLEPGLKFSWPEPIGRILTVSAKEAKLAVNEFWMFESPDKPLTPRGEGAVSTEGLRPGWDGALLTGDRALVHVKLTCLYRVGTRGGSPDAERVLDYVSNVADAEKLIEAAVCNGAIRAAAARTADSVYRAETEAFKAEVAKFAQQRLDEVGSGIEIQSIQLDATVPLATIKAFNDVQNARQERENEINEAKTEAIKILNGAAGKDWATLVGDREKAAKAATTAKTDRPKVFGAYLQARAAGDAKAMAAELAKIRHFGLLDLYADARERRDQPLADEVMAEIDRVLTDLRSGEAAGMISRARGYSSSIQQKVAGDVAEFKQLVGKFEQSPELMMQRLWVDVKIAILTSPTVEKIYVTSAQKFILRVSRDLEAARRIYAETISAKQDQEAQEK